MSHARFSPSSAEQWVNCPGSVVLQERYPDTSGDAADEGTRAHELAANHLLKGLPIVGDDEEMTDAVTMYCEHVKQFGLELHVEDRVVIDDDIWGTCDCWSVDYAKKTIRVYDFKYGHGYVEANDNKQLVMYLKGVMNKLEGISDLEWRFVATIIQPRAYGYKPIRYWTGFLSDIRATVNFAIGQKHIAQTKPTTKAGQHCRYCTARHACQTLHDMTLSVFDGIAEAKVMGLNALELGQTLTNLKKYEELLKAKITAVEQQVVNLISTGVSINGWTLQNTQGRMKWSVPVEEVIAKFGDDVKKVGVITPSQLVSKKTVDVENITPYTVRESTTKLVIDNGVKANEVFGK